MNQFYIAENGQKTGPFNIEELKQRAIYKDTLIWTESFDNWTRADQIPILKDIISSLPPPIPKTVEENQKEKIKSQLSSDSQSNIQSINPQDFTYAIFAAALSIILSFASYLIDDDNSKLYWKITIFTLFAEVRLWLYFRKYLENFKATKAIILTGWNIAMTISFGILEILLKILPDEGATEEWQDAETYALLLFVFFIVIAISSFIVWVKLGIALQKIKNDFIGLLKELGMSIAFLFPAVILLVIAGGIIENKTISLLGIALSNIPTVIMIMIFVRAKKTI